LGLCDGNPFHNLCAAAKKARSPNVFLVKVLGVCLARQQLFPYKSSYYFKNSGCQKFSFFNGGLKLGSFDIFDMLFPLLAFVKL